MARTAEDVLRAAAAMPLSEPQREMTLAECAVAVQANLARAIDEALAENRRETVAAAKKVIRRRLAHWSAAEREAEGRREAEEAEEILELNEIGDAIDALAEELGAMRAQVEDHAQQANYFCSLSGEQSQQIHGMEDELARLRALEAAVLAEDHESRPWPWHCPRMVPGGALPPCPACERLDTAIAACRSAKETS